MKFFTNKSIWTKIIIVLIFILIFEFVVSKPSLGMDMIEFGGKLVSPIVSLVIALGDGIMEIVNSSIMGTSEALLPVDTGTDWWEIFSKVVGAIVAVALAVVSVVLTGGLSLGALVVSLAAGYYTKSFLTDTFAKNGEQPIGSTMSFAKDNIPEDELYLPAYSISPEEIFQGKIMLFNVDFFGEGKEIKEKRGDDESIDYYFYLEDKDDENSEVITSPQDLGQELSGTISRWYVSLRNIGLVMMMIVLLYIGIRILLSTLASDKSKYKEMLKDWAIGMFLLFSVHYIMIFSNAIVNNITKVISSSIDTTNYYIQMEDNDGEKLSEFAEKVGREDIISEEKGPNGNPVIVWPTNLMGSLRLKTQLTNWGTEFIGYGICFVILVLFTCFFIFTYMKRVLYMAFLTLMAPLVAVTYPIDKISDGKAQGFDRWFKEYIFNLLIQPMHLLLYYVLITSAIELSSTNVLYSIVALGFMIPAEKMLRSFFGFEKSSTAGSMAAGATAAMAIGNLLKPKPHKSKDKDLKSADNSEDNKVRFKNEASVEDEFGKNPESRTIGDEKVNNNGNYDKNVNTDSFKADILDEEGNIIGQTEARERNDKLDSEEPKGQPKLIGEGTVEKNTGKSEEPERKPQLTARGTVKRNSENGKKSGKVERFIAATGNGVKAAAKRAAVKAPGALIRGAGKGFGIVAGATLGAAVGIAQGDFGKAVGYTASGATLGGTIGGKMTQGMSNGIDSAMSKRYNPQTFQQGFSEEYNNGNKYEDQLKQGEIKKAKREFKPSLNSNFDEKEVEKILEKDGDFDNLYRMGVTDKKDMQTIIKMLEKQDGKIDNYSKGAAVVKAAKEMGNEYKGLKSKDWENEWTRRFQSKQNMSEKDARAAAKEVMGLTKDFNKARSDLN